MRIFDKNELPLKNTLMAFKKFVGREIIKSFNKAIQFTDEPRLFEYVTEIRDYSKYSDAPFEEDLGSGLSYDKTTAQIKALGEAIERFCLSIYKRKDFKKCSFYDLGKKTIDPVRFLNFSENQLRIKKRGLQEKIRKYPFFWTKIFSLQDKERKYIPAQLVFVPYNLDKITLRHPISTGATIGTSYSGAIYRGVCEIIERDAFMICYLVKIPAPKIDNSSIKNKKIKELISYFKRYFLELHLFDITTDIQIPTVLTVVIDRTGVGPAVSIGAKSDLDTERAILGSIEEAQKVRTWIRYYMISNRKRFYKLKNNPKGIKSMEDRGLFWAHKHMIKKLDFLVNSDHLKQIRKTKVPKQSIPKLKKVFSILNNVGFSIYIKDLTPKNPPIKPFKVVKVVIPEAQPLYLYEEIKYLGGERLRKVPIHLGYKKSYKFRLNKVPHPFI